MTSRVQVPECAVALSTASAYPDSCTSAFEIAATLGYDAIEVMVWTDPVSQDPVALSRLSEHYRLPIVAIHAPTLLVTMRVWGAEPWPKLDRAKEVAQQVGAGVVVVHPPFRWQRSYTGEFDEGIARLQDDGTVDFAIENMFPWRARGREVRAYGPHWDPSEADYPHVTLDVSHASVAGSDVLEMADRLGGRLRHLHLADGTGSNKDEHLIPGRGLMPCGALLERLARRGFDGNVVLEVNTRRAPSREAREAELAEALAFTRLYLATAAPADAATD